MSFEIQLDKVYLYSPYGIGDSLMICAYSNAIDEKYEHNTVYLLKNAHKYIAEVYELKNYELVDQEFITQHDHLLTNTPKKGRICKFHPEFSGDSRNIEGFLLGKKSFKELYAHYFDVREENFVCPKHIVAKPCLEKINYAPLEKTVLFAPEMNASSSYDRVALGVYKNMIKEYKKRGYEVLVNARKKEVIEEFAECYVDVELSEFVWIAENCYKVVSSRSGIVDILAFLDINMEVLYPNIRFYEMYNLFRTYGITNISEIIVDRG